MIILVNMGQVDSVCFVLNSVDFSPHLSPCSLAWGQVLLLRGRWLSFHLSPTVLLNIFAQAVPLNLKTAFLSVTRAFVFVIQDTGQKCSCFKL